MTAAPVNGADQPTASAQSDPHRHFAANVRQSLREDYRLRADEADLAFGRYLRRQTKWVTSDEAAYDAYRWWTPPSTPGWSMPGKPNNAPTPAGPATPTSTAPMRNPWNPFRSATTPIGHGRT